MKSLSKLMLLGLCCLFMTTALSAQRGGKSAKGAQSMSKVRTAKKQIVKKKQAAAIKKYVKDGQVIEVTSEDDGNNQYVQAKYERDGSISFDNIEELPRGKRKADHKLSTTYNDKTGKAQLKDSKGKKFLDLNVKNTDNGNEIDW